MIVRKLDFKKTDYRTWRAKIGNYDYEVDYENKGYYSSIYHGLCYPNNLLRIGQETLKQAIAVCQTDFEKRVAEYLLSYETELKAKRQEYLEE